MNNTSRNYPRPIVPSHYTKQTIERMPHDEPCYVSADYDDMFEEPSFFVDEEGLLRAVGGTEIERYAFDKTRSPLGRIGIMRAALIGEGSSVRSVYVADMRFFGSQQLGCFEDMVESIDNQEEFMARAHMLETSIKFEGIIAVEEDTEYDRGNIPKGVFYGDEQLWPILKTLRKFGSRAMRDYFKESEQEEAADKRDAKKSRTKASKNS